MPRYADFGEAALRRRQGVLVCAAQREPLVLGSGEGARRSGALPAQRRDPRRIAVVEFGVGKCSIDLGNRSGPFRNLFFEFADAPPERGELAAFFRRRAAQIGAGGARFGGAAALRS